ncbi:hypothetical protein L9F63_018991, partial [Diploptera punctata]
KRCEREDRFTFNRNLIRIFKTEHDRIVSAAATGESQQDSPYYNADKIVLDWKFSTMDKNGDNVLVKTEYRDLRRLVKKVVKPKRCAKTFTKLCDPNEDENISRDEWVSCLGLDFNYGVRRLTRTSTSKETIHEASLSTLISILRFSID